MNTRTIRFLFSYAPSLEGLHEDFIYETHLDIPDLAWNLPDCEERVLEISRLIAEFSRATVHVSYEAMGVEKRAIKQNPT